MDTSDRADIDRDRAFQQVVVPELELLYAMAVRLTRDPDEAEDLVQDTLLRAYRGIHRFDGRHPRAWLLTILRNTNINRGRKRTPALLFDPDQALGRVPARGPDGRDGAAEPALDGIVDPVLLAAHLRDCERCGIEAEVYEQVKASLRELHADPDPAAVDRLRRFAADISST